MEEYNPLPDAQMRDPERESIDSHVDVSMLLTDLAYCIRKRTFLPALTDVRYLNSSGMSL